MASILKHLRSSTADKRPTASGLAEGQIAINTASGTPAVFFKDNNGGVVKVGPAHVGSAAPNAVPAGSSGNSLGELWVDNSLTTAGLKYYTGSTFVNLTPSGTTTTVGLVELATGAETQTGTDAVRAVTPSGLQSKVSDSTSTTSSTTIASSTAVKAAYDLANAALPKAGGTVTGELLIGTTGSLVFEGTTDDSFETTLAVVDPTADRTITFPNVTGTVVTTGDSGTVTSTMIANDTIVNADVNSAAAIAYSKLALSSGIVNTDVSASAAIAFSKLASMTAGNILLGNASNVPTSTAVTGDVTISNAGVTAIASGVIVNADVNASAAIAGTKISPDFGSQTITTTGVISAALGAEATPSITFTGDLNTGIYSPGADQVAISTSGTGRLFVTSDGKVGIGGTPSNPLDVFGSATLGIRYKSSGSYAGIIADNTSSTGGGYFGAYQNGSQKAIFGVTGAFIGDTSADAALFAETGQAIRFFTNGSVTEKARIDSSGRLGLGTSSPGSLLDLVGGNIRLDSVYGINKSNADGYIHLSGGTSNVLGGTIFCFGQSHTGNANEIHFRNSGNQTRAVIDSSGNVGVGTTTVNTTLEVFNSSTPIIRVGDGTRHMELRGGSTTQNAAIGTNYGGGFDIIQNGSAAVTIDSSKRVLVGTSTARTDFFGSLAANVQVEGSSFAAYSCYATAGNGAFIFGRGTPISGSNLGVLSWQADDGTDEVQAASITAYVDGTPGANDMPGRIVLSTTADGASSPTERMRISQNGTIDTYGTPTDAGFAVRVSHGAGTAYGLFSGKYSASSTATGTNSFYVYTNGNVVNTNNSYGALSDAKLKENIVDAASQWSDIKALQIRKYNFKEGQTHTQIGLIAQEVELVSPGLVSESPDRDEDGNDLGTVTKSVNYSVLYMKAVKALQEAMERIEVLEQRLTDAGIA